MIYETKRLYIRDFETDDLNEFHRLVQDPDIYKYLPWGPNSKEDTKNFIQTSIEQSSKTPRKFFDMPILLKETSSIAGCIRITVLNHKEAEIGYWIGKGLWGQGLATEATLGILGFGFQKFKMNKIYAKSNPKNLASIRVLKKAGMVKEGYLKKDIYVRGQYRDSVLMAISKKGFILHKKTSLGKNM